MLNKTETATFGGGCFWCTEAVYQELDGVLKVESGYAGGQVVRPSYQQVCSGTTGHAEVIQITFDPDVISFEELLDVFWVTHDPTTLNRQGADVGPQYRSAIFYHSDEQKAAAEKSRLAADAAGLWPNPIVTEVSPLTNYYPAEDYHQNYYRNNEYQPYCQFVIAPKMKKLRQVFGNRLKTAG